jgi:hypothetical protein
MATIATEPQLRSFEIVKSEDIDAPLEIVFETLLEQMGPLNETGDNSPMPMVLEAWPGGRWYRDLGNNTGHFWGHVQVIKPPALIEINGPMFMSYPAVSHLQYRLTKEAGGTRLTLRHRAFGEIVPEHAEGVQHGWAHQLRLVRKLVEQRLK